MIILEWFGTLREVILLGIYFPQWPATDTCCRDDPAVPEIQSNYNTCPITDVIWVAPVFSCAHEKGLGTHSSFVLSTFAYKPSERWHCLWQHYENCVSLTRIYNKIWKKCFILTEVLYYVSKLFYRLFLVFIAAIYFFFTIPEVRMVSWVLHLLSCTKVVIPLSSPLSSFLFLSCPFANCSATRFLPFSLPRVQRHTLCLLFAKSPWVGFPSLSNVD